MKNFKYSIAFLAIAALLFTSCSKDEASDVISDQDTFQLQFGVLLNDFNKVQTTKDHNAPPVECREDDPAYVKVGIKKSDGFFVGDNNGDFVKDVVLLEVNIKNNNNSWETVFSDDLGLPAGNYSLEYFIVYDADDEILWVAPRTGGAYASSVTSPLPKPILLGAGTKPYIDVDVLCFIPREEEAYGYLFFDFELTEVVNNYCIFVNFCDDTSGREYPAKFMVEVWKNSKIPANSISLDPNMNSVSGAGNSFAATVLCMPLPPLVGQDVYIVRVTVLDAGTYDAGAADFKEFTITQADITGQLLEVPAYEHIRINCEDDDGNGECDPNDDTADCDGDTIPNGDDKCPGKDDRLDLDIDGTPDGCDNDRDGDGKNNEVDSCPDVLKKQGQVDLNNNGCWTDPIVVGCTDTDCDLTTTAGGDCYDTSIDLADSSIIYKVTQGESFELRGNKSQLEPNVQFGTATVSISGVDAKVTLDTPKDFDKIKGYKVKVYPSNNTGERDDCFQAICDNGIIFPDGNQGEIVLTFSEFDYSYPIYLTVEAIICEDVPLPD